MGRASADDQRSLRDYRDLSRWNALGAEDGVKQKDSLTAYGNKATWPAPRIFSF
jgi:hypothetical protein